MLGKSLLSKIFNSIALIALLIYAATKVLPLLGITASTDINLEAIAKEQVQIRNSNLLHQDLLINELNSFSIDAEELAISLQGSDTDISKFQERVKIEFVIPEDLQSSKEMTLEFITNKADNTLKPAFKNIAIQLDAHLNKKG